MAEDTSPQVIQRDGRRWSVDSTGITTLKRPYRIVLADNNLGANGEGSSFSGLPAIGSAHPNNLKLFVLGYDVEEGKQHEKKILDVTVNYGPKLVETYGSGQDAQSVQVEQWGWAGGEDERELVTAADGTPVLNSAGDVFDSVPTIKHPAPVFTKVVKFKARQSGWSAHRCKVNSSAVTIGGETYAAATLLCMVSEVRVVGDGEWKYRYTIELRLRTNMVKIAGSGSASEIGWDVAIADAGMRELSSDGTLKLIRVMDAETGIPCNVTTPELLDGSGHSIARSASGAPVTPYNKRFQAYGRTTFPTWFYSEPS